MISRKRKKMLCEWVNYECEQCHKFFKHEGLNIHRIKREWQGGTYKDFRNLKVVCKSCHKKIHEREFI